MNSIKQKILLYLQEKNSWVHGGLIDDYIRQTDGHKASNCSRRCRELVNEGKIERRLVTVEGTPNKVVQYKYVVQNENSSSRSPIQPSHPDAGQNVVPVQLSVHQGYAWKSDQPFPETKKRVSAVRPRKRGLGLF